MPDSPAQAEQAPPAAQRPRRAPPAPRKRCRRILAALVALIQFVPIAARAQECDTGVAGILNEAARGGLEYEVRRDEVALRPPASVFDLGCLNSLLSLNINIFSGGMPSLEALLAMGTRMLCNYAQQEFARLTAPLQGTWTLPGLPGALGSAIGLNSFRIGSVGIGYGTGGMTINGANYSAAGILGGDWLQGLAGQGNGGYGAGQAVTIGGISGETLLANGVAWAAAQQAAATAATNAINGLRPPPGGLNPLIGNMPLPAGYSQVVGEDFTNGSGIFSRVWGSGVDTSVPGQLTIRRSADDSDSGAMVPPTGTTAGYGYGLYTFDLVIEGNSPGPYALLWPSTDVWPGPEMDLIELLPGGQPYSTLHWNDNGNNGFESKTYDGVNPNQRHIYQYLWTPTSLTAYVDGQPMATWTENVPRSAADGGENAAPGIGMQTRPHLGAQTGQPNSITLYGFSYSEP